MTLGKLLLAVAGAAMLLGALVSSVSARNLELSSQTNFTLWRSLRFTAFAPVECEVRLNGSLHARTFAKTANSLIGYITEAWVLRCTTGSFVIHTGSLPWHLRYTSFTGVLPNITSQGVRLTGAEYTITDNAFGYRCTVWASNSALTVTYTVSSGTITRIEIGGVNRCNADPVEVTVSGSETNFLERSAGARITIRLI
jgi:hypothetical protein